MDETIQTLCTHCSVRVTDDKYVNCALCFVYYHYDCIRGRFTHENEVIAESVGLYFLCPKCDDRAENGDFSYEILVSRYEAMVSRLHDQNEQLDRLYIAIKEVEFENEDLQKVNGILKDEIQYKEATENIEIVVGTFESLQSSVINRIGSFAQALDERTRSIHNENGGGFDSYAAVLRGDVRSTDSKNCNQPKLIVRKITRRMF